MPRRALIAGLGLIGGSIALALTRRGWRVAYLDPFVDDDDVLRAGAADERVERFDAVDADVIVLATPVDVAASQLAAMPPVRGVITSVCSVMAPLVAAAGARKFVAGHPMGGSEKRGFAHADAALLAGKRWFVTAEDEVVEELIAACGAESYVLDAEAHDHVLARTSHLPQLLSTAFAATLHEEMLDFGGGGLRTFARLAGSDASVWRPILDANSEAVVAAAEEVIEMMQRLIDGDDEPFARAQRIHAALAKRG